MPRRTTKAIAGVALAALAAAGVAAVVNQRRGQQPDADEHARLDELDARLGAQQEARRDTRPDRVGRIFDGLQRDRGISVARLRAWITGLREGALSVEQAIAAESDFGSLEREADQGGV